MKRIAENYLRLAPNLFIAFWLGGASPIQALDVSLYAVVKGQSYVQTDANAPVLTTNNPYSFNAVVVPSGANTVHSAAMQVPDGSLRTLEGSASGLLFSLSETFASQSALDAKYSAGSYTFGIDTVHDGLRVLAINLLRDDYPNTPTILNLDAAQAVVATNDFTLAWEPFENGTTNDVVQIMVLDGPGKTIYSSPALRSPGALDGTSTSGVIPANKLQPGANYQASLTFGRTVNYLLNFPAYFGAVGAAGYAKQTAFTLRTVSPPPPKPPRLEILSPAAGGQFQLRVTVETGHAYNLQSSTNLADWLIVLTTNAAASSIDFTIPPIAKPGSQFYRAVAP